MVAGTYIYMYPCVYAIEREAVGSGARFVFLVLHTTGYHFKWAGGGVPTGQGPRNIRVLYHRRSGDKQGELEARGQRNRLVAHRKLVAETTVPKHASMATLQQQAVLVPTPRLGAH